MSVLRTGRSGGFWKTEIERDDAGKALRLVGAHADVTDQVLAEEALRRSEEKYRTLAEELSSSLAKLQAAQVRLIQTEKLASLGQLTAGIAHEIKNPLNFINNSSRLSNDRINELLVALSENAVVDIDRLTKTLKRNLEKILQHGHRADRIVKNMLMHSRSASTEHRPIEINAVIDDALNLAYHGARAEQPGFNVEIVRELDANAGKLDLYPQDISRAFLNLFSNGFYAAIHRSPSEAKIEQEPTLCVQTRDLGAKVEIRIRDNGAGIPSTSRQKIFDPFFTTKPAGEGTGLGLSICHDIIVTQHGGTIDVETEKGNYTEFIVTLPRKSFDEVV